MAKKKNKSGIVRRYDKNGRKYYIDKSTGKKASPDKWIKYQIEKKQSKAEAADRGKPKRSFFIEESAQHRNFLDTVQSLLINNDYKAEITDESGQVHKFKKGESLGFGLLIKKVWKAFEKILRDSKKPNTSPDITYFFRDYLKIRLITCDLRDCLFSY